MTGNKILSNKRAASEAFNVILPILIAIVVFIIFFFIFAAIKQSLFGKQILNKKELAIDSVQNNMLCLNFNTILNSKLNYKDEKGKPYNYNISVYDIFYYQLERRYETEIRDYLDKLMNEICTQDDTLAYCPGIKGSKTTDVETMPIFGMAYSENKNGGIMYSSAWDNEIASQFKHGEKVDTGTNILSIHFDTISLCHGIIINGKELHFVIYVPKNDVKNAAGNLIDY